MKREILQGLVGELHRRIWISQAAVQGCDGTLQHTREWLWANSDTAHDDLAWVRRHGAHCDCGVLLPWADDCDREVLPNAADDA